MFIHGLLDEDPKRRWGTCASIPVLVTAVARRLGYPVGLAVVSRHIYARWEGGGVCFNIEASNPMGMTVHSDDEFREKIKKTEMVPDEEKSGYYLRTLFPAEEFALFLAIRVEALIDAARYEDTLLWSPRALQLAPDDPRLPYIAHYALDLAMKHRLWRIHPEQKIPLPDGPQPFFFHVGDLLRLEERSLHMTIVARYEQAKRELDEARRLYEDACRQNFHGNNEQCDFQRFLRKHDLTRRAGPLLPPKNLGQPRRWTLACKPHEEADMLRRMADQFERDGERVKARDALYDLYMFDPSDAGVFQRARPFDDRPQFQEQLKALIANRRRELQQSGALRKIHRLPIKGAIVMSYSPTLGRWMETDPIGTLAEHPDILGVEGGATPFSAPGTDDVTVTAIEKAVDKGIAKFGVEAVASTLQLLQYAEGANTYEFVSFNPVNATDPSGLDRYVVDGGLGHHGIAIDQWTVVNGKWVNLGPVTYDFSINYWYLWAGATQLIGIPAGGKVRRTPGINGKIQSTIPSCPQADMTLQGNMDAAVINPPLYSLPYYNCNWFVLKHLLDGINVPPSK